MTTNASGSSFGVLARTLRNRALTWAMVFTLAGCASAPSVPEVPALPQAADLPAIPATENSGALGFLSGLGDKAMETLGLKKPELPDTSQLPSVPDSALPDWRVGWRIFASDSLNVDDEGHSLGLLVRIYKLKSPDAFMQAPYDTFGDAAKEKAALNDDLLAAREVQLLPGQRYESKDKVARDAPFIGIVALFRKPMNDHWRYAFKTADAAKTGLNLGAHACALSVQVGEAIGTSARSARFVGMPCP
jgi:type VI secretion system protein VasD